MNSFMGRNAQASLTEINNTNSKTRGETNVQGVSFEVSGTFN